MQASVSAFHDHKRPGSWDLFGCQVSDESDLLVIGARVEIQNPVFPRAADFRASVRPVTSLVPYSRRGHGVGDDPFPGSFASPEVFPSGCAGISGGNSGDAEPWVIRVKLVNDCFRVWNIPGPWRFQKSCERPP